MALKSVSYRSNTERRFERKVVENRWTGLLLFQKNGLEFGEFLKKFFEKLSKFGFRKNRQRPKAVKRRNLDKNP